MKVKNLFKVSYGNRQYHSKKWLEGKIGKTPLISSKASNHGVYGFFDIVPDYQGHIITMPSTGSIGYSCYQELPCSVDDNTLVLQPVVDLTIRKMLYYSLVFREIGKHFMYGRQVTPSRLGEFEIPSIEEIPDWVETIELPSLYEGKAKNQEKVELPNFSKWKNFKYDDIFIMNRGKGGKATDAKNNPGINHYIGASDISNGITQCTSLPTTEQGNSITVANNGSVGAAFYQPIDFLASSDVTVLTLKDRELTPQIALFLCTLIRQEGVKVNYGRKWGISRMRESIISLPVNEQGEPDWQLMEDYINSLPYSATL